MDNLKNTYHLDHVYQTETASPAQSLDFTKIIPEELVIEIFSCLDISDLERASLVNREWNRLANDNILWKKIYFAIERFPAIHFPMTSYKSTVKVFYLLALEKAKQIPSIPQKLVEGPKSISQFHQLQNKFISHERCKQLARYIKHLPNAAPPKIASILHAVDNDIITDQTFFRLMGWVKAQDIKHVWQKVAAEAHPNIDIDESQFEICDWEKFNTAFADWMERGGETVKNLQKLDLSSCNLAYIPTCLEKLTNLKTLFLNNNSLTELPESLGNLRQLTRLNLEGNYLTRLPASLANHPNLSSLSIGQNKLSALPDLIKDLKNLSELRIDFILLDSFISSPKNLERLEIVINRHELPLLGLFQLPVGNYTVEPLIHGSVHG
jgi:hypothetical protein